MKKLFVAAILFVFVLEGTGFALNLHRIEMDHGTLMFFYSPLQVEDWIIKEVKRIQFEKEETILSLNKKLASCYNYFHNEISLQSFDQWTKGEWQRFNEHYVEWNESWLKYPYAMSEFDLWCDSYHQDCLLILPEMEDFQIELDIIHSKNPYSGIRCVPWQE